MVTLDIDTAVAPDWRMLVMAKRSAPHQPRRDLRVEQELSHACASTSAVLGELKDHGERGLVPVRWRTVANELSMTFVVRRCPLAHLVSSPC
jgi:hypothetical protein